ncbi:MAG: hypothetical protein U0168_02830 [Nannocystaceae bacterium]
MTILVICAAASLAATWLLLDRPDPPGPSTRRVAQTSVAVQAQPRPDAHHPARSDERGAAVDADDARPTRATREAVVRATHEDGESELTLRWKDLAPAERLRILQDDFEKAVVVLEEPGLAVREQTDAQHTAEGALSAMRAELYDSERGRALHQRYEERLERAVAAREPGGG